MQLQAAIKGKKLSTDYKTISIVATVKAIVHQFDAEAEIILFGSRARGDWHEESEWDFLVLTGKENTEELSNEIRRAILHRIELVTFDGIFVLVKNKKIWEEAYLVTPLYYIIAEEGIRV